MLVGRAGDSSGVADGHGEKKSVTVAMGGGRCARGLVGQAGRPQQPVQPEYFPQRRPSTGEFILPRPSSSVSVVEEVVFFGFRLLK